jgi:hypothetical protein
MSNLILTNMARVKKVKTGAVICGLDDILFPVELTPNPRKTNKEYSRVVTGIIGGEEMDLNYCSNIYKLVENARIFPNIEEVLDANGIEYEVEYKHINHVRFYADYKITDKRFGYKMKGTNDMIMPMLRVQHSYNGLTKYRIIFGYYRMVCTNGLIIAVEEMKKFNLVIIGKHTEAIVNSFAKLDMMLKFFSANASTIVGEITAKYEMLGGRWVSDPEDRLKEVLGASKITIVENNKFNTLNDIMGRITEESEKKNLGYNGRVNDWLIYNGINQYLNDNSRNIMNPEVRIEKDSKVFEYMLANA